MDQLALYSKNCKRCGFMDQNEPKKYTSCHFDRGNTDCPAKEVQFVIVGKARRLATELKQVRVQGNLKREMQILQEVNERNKAFQQKFKEWLAT